MALSLKHYIFFLSLFVFVPVGSLLGNLSKRIEAILIFLSIFFSCRLAETINFISFETYRGTSRGFEISLVDLMSLCLFTIVIFNRKKIKIFPPGSFLYFIYFSFSLFSIMNAASPLFSFMEIFKMARMYFFYWVTYNIISGPREIKIIMESIYLIIFYIFTIVIFDKYIGGRYQARGPFPHQNSLVMYMLLFSGPIISKILNYKLCMKSLMTAMMSSLCILLTYSRAGLALFGLSIGMIYLIGLIEKFEPKKLLTLFMMFICALLVFIKSFDTIVDRFLYAPKESAETRVYMAETAINMANDRFFGIGLNNWGIKVNKPYTYSKHSPRFHEEGFKEGLVETTYLMIAAETGWLNLVVFITFILGFLSKSIRLVKRFWKTKNSYFFIGLTAGLFTIYLESTLEWVLKQTPNFYQLMLIYAIIAAVYNKNISLEEVKV